MINLDGTLFDFSTPVVMGILNVTPDSFFSAGRYQTYDKICYRTEEIVQQGGKIIDVGGYSSRPGADEVSETEEIERVIFATEIIRKKFPYLPVSVDTFRAKVAEMAVTDFGASIINDISGGELDEKMFRTVARLNVPYILMHMKGNPRTMDQKINYENFIQEVFTYFAKKIDELNLLGVKDIIIDPGFGFAKSLQQNYELLARTDLLSQFGLPILAGVSRKRMIWQLLHTTPQESLNGTTVLHTLALQQGASILRVHDVKEAVETIKIFMAYNQYASKTICQ